MNKGSFLFRKEWADAMKGQPSKARLKLYEAIMEYAFTDKLNTRLVPLSMAVFLAAKAVIDKDRETSEMRRMAGQKGKRKKKKTVVRKKSTDIPVLATEVATVSTTPPLQPPPPIPVESEPGTGDSAKIIEVKKPVSSTPTIEHRQRRFYESLVPFVEKYGREMVRDFYEYWTETTRSGAKMRFELQPTWVVSKRLARWNLQSKSKVLQHDQSTSNPEARARDAALLIASLAEDE